MSQLPDEEVRPLLGAVEGGGTKFLCAVGTGDGQLRAQARFETTNPSETLAQVGGFFEGTPVAAIGVGMFGPLELTGAKAGSTLATPKTDWNDVPVARLVSERVGAPVAVDTDVNAAALAEACWGAARSARVVMYMTVGTGIGVGCVIDQVPLHGLLHPELGHLPVPRLQLHGQLDPLPGGCRFHERCLEGVAAGPALARRLGADPQRVPPDAPGWDFEARYLAHGLAAGILALSPEKIVLGGGVASNQHLLPRVRAHVQDLLGGYIPRRELGSGIEAYIVRESFGGRAGLMGGLALARTLAGSGG